MRPDEILPVDGAIIIGARNHGEYCGPSGPSDGALVGLRGVGAAAGVHLGDRGGEEESRLAGFSWTDSFAAFRLHEVCKYVTLGFAMSAPMRFSGISIDAWNALPEA